ncbi:SDR family oxidoreductase [bacterium]|nr:SDR family oxidoreductase [bacterium]
MRKRKILITGASGFLGNHLTKLYLGEAEKFEVFATFYNNHPHGLQGIKLIGINLGDSNTTKDLIQKIQPDICFHLAALSSPDKCHTNQELAKSINILGTKNLVDSLPVSCKLIFTSTDLVFDGEKGWYSESDSPNPTNYYSQTKLEAEKITNNFKGIYCIVRLSLMFGWGDDNHQSFSDWIINSIRGEKTIGLYTDQFRTMIYVKHAALILKWISESSIKGTVHLGGFDRISRYNFGIQLCEAFGLSNRLLRPVKMGICNGKAVRGRDCSLSTTRLIHELGIKPYTIKMGLEDMKRDDSFSSQQAF